MLKDKDVDMSERKVERVLQYMYPNYSTMTPREKWAAWKKLRPPRRIRNYDPVVASSLKIDLRCTEKDFPVSVRLCKPSQLKVEEVKDVLPIKVSPVCRWVGQTPFPIGSRPQKFRYFSREFVSFLNETKDIKDYRHVLKDMPEQFIACGAWPTLVRELERFGEQVPHTFSWGEYSRGFFVRKDRLIMPRILRKPDSLEIYSQPINPKADPGLITRKEFGSTKAKCFGAVSHIAKMLYDKTAIKPTQDLSLWHIGGRERRNKLVPGTKVRSRPVWMPEMSSSLLAQLYSRPIMSGIQNLQGQSLDMEVMCGSSFNHNGWDKFRKRFVRKLNIIHADWKNFDSSIVEEVMVLAFGIARSCYPEDEVIDNHFLFIASGFIHKQVALPGRFIYMISKGVPSGSSFTTIIDTLCCWIVWSAIMNKLVGKECRDLDMALYGDDSMVTLPVNFSLPPKIEEKILMWTGMVVDPFKVSSFESIHVPEDNSSFLKTVSYHGLPGRNTADVTQILMYPTKQNKGWYDNSEKVTSMLHSSPFNMEATEMIIAYRNFCITKALGRGRPPPEWMVGQEARDSIENTYIKLACCTNIPPFDQRPAPSSWGVEQTIVGGYDKYWWGEKAKLNRLLKSIHNM